MEEYGLSEEDFSDFYKTTETLLSLYQQVPENRYVHCTEPDYVKLIPEIFDYTLETTAICSIETQELLKRCQMIPDLLDEKVNSPEYVYQDDTDMFSEKERILEFCN